MIDVDQNFVYASDLTVLLIVCSIIFGLVIHTKWLWSFRQYLAFIEVILISASMGMVIMSQLNITLSLLLSITGVYRLFSFFRVVKNRINSSALRLKSFRSEILLSLVTVCLLVVNHYFLGYITSEHLVTILAGAQFIIAIIYYLHLRQSIENTSLINTKSHLTDDDLPAITVAVPARNETYELTDCLQSLLASNYPKMEILVLDDCSQDRTSDIIKRFAHGGARFIAGKVPPTGWMTKNWAYQQLLEESDGKYILFCGTDVRYDKSSIRTLIEQMIISQKEMISVLPTRNNLHGIHQIIQPMRYWRELVLPQIFKATPPTLSTLWVANKSQLNKYGGFRAFKKSIRPEKHFSKRFLAANKYKFLRSSSGLGIASMKGYKSQINTATRMRYPEHKNRPENVFIYSVWELLFLLLPLPLAIYCLITELLLGASLSLLASILLLTICYKLDQSTNGRPSWLKILIFPFSVLSEIAISNYSMWAYEFDEVLWKGRNICLPVVNIIPKLPKF